MQRVLMTGACGFLGTNFLSYCKKNVDRNDLNIIPLTSKNIEGYRCVLYDDAASGSNQRTFSAESFKNAKIPGIDVVLLMGAYVEHGEKERIVYNHISSINNIVYLLEHLPNVPKKIVFISSVAVYGFTQDGIYTKGEMPVVTEETPVNPKRTYALSKVICERYVEEWAKEHNCQSVILRLGSMYGKERRFYNFLGTCVSCAKNKATMDMFAPLEKTWNFVYVDDVSKWIINAIKSDNLASPINLCSSHLCKTQEVLDIVSEVYPDFSYKINSNHVQTGQDRLFDSTVREKYLGKEDFDLKSGLMRIVSEDVGEGDKNA